MKTCPLSTVVTRVIGTKIRRRPKTSTTRPRTRGWLSSERTATTTSRTLRHLVAARVEDGQADQAGGVHASRRGAHGPTRYRSEHPESGSTKAAHRPSSVCGGARPRVELPRLVEGPWRGSSADVEARASSTPRAGPVVAASAVAAVILTAATLRGLGRRVRGAVATRRPHRRASSRRTPLTRAPTPHPASGSSCPPNAGEADGRRTAGERPEGRQAARPQPRRPPGRRGAHHLPGEQLQRPRRRAHHRPREQAPLRLRDHPDGLGDGPAQRRQRVGGRAAGVRAAAAGGVQPDRAGLERVARPGRGPQGTGQLGRLAPATSGRFVEGHTIPIPYFHGKAKPMPYLLLRHLGTGQQVWFANFHNPADVRGPAGKWRAVAVARETALANPLSASGLPVIFTGDFNAKARLLLRDDDALLDALLQRRLHRQPLPAPRQHGHRLDHGFLTGQLHQPQPGPQRPGLPDH